MKKIWIALLVTVLLIVGSARISSPKQSSPLRIVEAQTAAVASGGILPINTILPKITDGGQGGGRLSSPKIKDVLSGTNGTWKHALRYTYKWLDCNTSGSSCTAIYLATTKTYVVQAHDVGHTIRFKVTAYS